MKENISEIINFITATGLAVMCVMGWGYLVISITKCLNNITFIQSRCNHEKYEIYWRKGDRCKIRCLNCGKTYKIKDWVSLPKQIITRSIDAE